MNSYRIFIIDTYYPDFLKKEYSEIKNTGMLDSHTYSSLKKILLSKQFGTSDFYSHALNETGSYAEEFIINDEHLQKKWAEENGLHLKFQNPLYGKIPYLRSLHRKNWFYKILSSQIEKFKPDIIFNQNIGAIEPIFFKQYKNRKIKIVGQIASRLPPKSFFKPYDLIVSSLPHYVSLFREWGIKSEFLALAFDPRVITKIENSPLYPITHVGGYGPIHNERNEILEKAAEKIAIDFWGYGIDNLSPESMIRKNYHGEAWGSDMYRVLQNSCITLTKHITSVAGSHANNMTLYEATGCGCLLITDYKENLHELFIPGQEIETYRTPEELIEKALYYLKNETDRKKIATAGQKRTLKDHTYSVRIQKLIPLINKLHT